MDRPIIIVFISVLCELENIQLSAMRVVKENCFLLLVIGSRHRPKRSCCRIDILFENNEPFNASSCKNGKQAYS